jgi:hypothetical protein
MRRPRMTTRRWMLVVAVAGFSLGGLAWFLRNQAFNIHDMFFQIGPYVFRSTSPAFWAILGLGLAVLWGLVAGLIETVALTARAIGRAIFRKP